MERIADKLKFNLLTGLEKRLTQITPLNGSFRLELKYDLAPDYTLLLTNLMLSVKEAGQTIALSESGSGTQSMAVFALYAYLAELESKTFILGVEEPEQNLHPQAQRQLAKALINLDLQVLFTTHSPTVVDALDHEQVVLCRRVKGKKRALEVKVSQIDASFFSQRHLDRDKYYKFHRRRNSEFMFADFVIVTESPADSLVIETLLEESGFSLSSHGVNIMALDGVTSLPYMYHILSGLDIGHCFIVDKDYFLPYKNSNRDSSLDSRGYPQYGSAPKSNTLLPTLFPDEEYRKQVVECLLNDSDSARKMLLGVNFFCFNYAIEVDLVKAKEPRERFYDLLGISADQRSETSLLTVKNNWKQLKDQANIVSAISGLPPRSMPLSYLNIRREIPRMVRASRPTI